MRADSMVKLSADRMELQLVELLDKRLADCWGIRWVVTTVDS